MTHTFIQYKRSAMSYTVRQLIAKEVPRFLMLAQRLDRETDFLATADNDPRPNFMQVISLVKSGDQIVFIAEEKGEFIGLLGGFWRRGKKERLRHNMTVGIAVLQAHWGKGVGSALMEAFEVWAKANGIHRIGLEVMEHNEAAKALYLKMGYEVEGLKRHSICVNGTYINEYMMSKLL